MGKGGPTEMWARSRLSSCFFTQAISVMTDLASGGKGPCFGGEGPWFGGEGPWFGAEGPRFGSEGAHVLGLPLETSSSLHRSLFTSIECNTDCLPGLKPSET